jgi:hypothetical protein
MKLSLCLTKYHAVMKTYPVLNEVPHYENMWECRYNPTHYLLTAALDGGDTPAQPQGKRLPSPIG